MNIDIERLREDMKEDSLGGFYGGGFGGALMESFDIKDASPAELVEMARERGVDLRRYKV